LKWSQYRLRPDENSKVNFFFNFKEQHAFICEIEKGVISNCGGQPWGVDLLVFNPFFWWRRDEEKGWDASIGYSGEKMFSSSKFREMLKTKQFVDYKGRVKAFARSLDLIR
jgi:hypothetical protein